MQNRQQAKERIDKLIKTCSLSGIDGIMLSKMTTFEMEELRNYVEQQAEEEQQKFYTKIEQTYPEELRTYDESAEFR